MFLNLAPLPKNASLWELLIYTQLKDNLFSKKKEIALNKGKIEAIDKVEALKTKLPEKIDYLEDLYYVLKELDALPDRYAKAIRAIDLKNLDREIKELEKEVPHNYLLNIIDREKKIDEGRESLILSEELI
jgi:hypothetical protein